MKDIPSEERKVFGSELNTLKQEINKSEVSSQLELDISNELESKVDALKAYHYEIRKTPHPRSKEMMEATVMRWGSLSGYHAAEAFELVRIRLDDLSKISF